MPLESLSQPFNPDEPRRKLREVQVEHETHHESKAEEMYNTLKNSDFYDEEKKMWKFGEGASSDAHPYEQLLGLLALAKFDPLQARQQWEEWHSMEVTNLQDPKNPEWKWGDLKTNTIESKLLSIALQLLFDKQGGMEEYIQLCKKMHASGPHLMPQPLDGNHELYTKTELLHVYVNTALHPQEAKARYRALQATDLYDTTKHLWHMLYRKRNGASGGYYSSNFLLSIMVELQLGITGAEKKYETAKLSPLFDVGRQMWNSAVSDHGANAKKFTENQLLAVIVESRIEKMKTHNNFPHQQQLPEERNF